MNRELPSFISREVVEGTYFFADLAPREEADFGVACGGIEVCSPDYQLDRSGFRFIGIEYVISGSAEVEIGDESFNARMGTLFGYRPEDRLKIRSSGKGSSPLVKGFVDLYGDKALELFEAGPLAMRKPVDYAGSVWMEHTFRQMVDRGNEGGESSKAFCVSAAEMLLQHVRGQEIQQADTYSISYQSYRKCRECLQLGFRTIRSVSDLSNKVHLAPAYISRLFQSYSKESPLAYLTRLKMSEAAGILMKDTVSVKEVCERVGYDDPAYFSRVFRKTFGVPPKHFNRSIKRF